MLPGLLRPAIRLPWNSVPGGLQGGTALTILCEAVGGGFAPFPLLSTGFTADARLARRRWPGGTFLRQKLAGSRLLTRCGVSGKLICAFLA